MTGEVLKRPLILQRQFRGQAAEAATVVTPARLRLALAAPARPVQAEALLLRRVQQEREQAADLGDG
jgi:hypothetical protein